MKDAINKTYNASLTISSDGFPFDDILDSKDVSSTSETDSVVGPFDGGFLDDLLIKCLSA